ncbi:MAG: YtxH domain-containing protein [Dehalococcoidia bacterium]|nr:YtxH domain-containing protein [Dehalococcoidia bacterium]
MTENGTGTGFGIGILAGAVAGVALGLLYAPHPGKETRLILKNKAGETLHKAEDILEEARERAKRIIHDAKGKAQEIEAGSLNANDLISN